MNDSLQFSVTKLLALPVVYALALPFWKVTAAHGIAATVSATALSGAILLSKRRDHVALALRFVLAIGSALLVGLVAEAVLSPIDPHARYAVPVVYVTVALGGISGWHLARYLTRPQSKTAGADER